MAPSPPPPPPKPPLHASTNMQTCKHTNRFKNLCVYYNNIRGVKSKITSLEEIINEINPHIICLNEKHLDQQENIGIEVSRETKEYETLRIKISNNKNINIRIGNIYMPHKRVKQKSKQQNKV